MNDIFIQREAEVRAAMEAFDAKIAFWDFLMWLSLWWMFGAAAALLVSYCTKVWNRHPECRIPIVLVCVLTVIISDVFMARHGYWANAKSAFIKNGYK